MVSSSAILCVFQDKEDKREGTSWGKKNSNINGVLYVKHLTKHFISLT